MIEFCIIPGGVQEETGKLAAEACAAGVPPEVNGFVVGSSVFSLLKTLKLGTGVHTEIHGSVGRLCVVLLPYHTLDARSVGPRYCLYSFADALLSEESQSKILLAVG